MMEVLATIFAKMFRLRCSTRFKIHLSILQIFDSIVDDTDLVPYPIKIEHQRLSDIFRVTSGMKWFKAFLKPINQPEINKTFQN